MKLLLTRFPDIQIGMCQGNNRTTWMHHRVEECTDCFSRQARKTKWWEKDTVLEECVRGQTTGHITGKRADFMKLNINENITIHSDVVIFPHCYSYATSCIFVCTVTFTGNIPILLLYQAYLSS